MTVRSRRRSYAALAGCLAVLCAAGCGGGKGDASSDATSSPASPVVAPAAPSAEPGTALAAVGLLAVKGRAPLTGYSREQFGQAWYDYDRNGCDTRNDILRRDLTNISIKPGTHGCKVLAGDDVPDPYTGKSISFVYGGQDDIDIDHVVALANAWQTGAQQWPADKRLKLANDPLNLLAVSASANRQKSAGDAATWLPANKAFRCQYVARQVAVKKDYGLWVTSAERDAMVRVLTACPHQELPTGGDVPLAPEPTPTPTPTPTQTSPAPPPNPTQTQAPPAAPAGPATDPQFRTCKEAKAHGYGPYHEGTDPEYNWYRDADHDGIVCE
jgi:hypothetical protein